DKHDNDLPANDGCDTTLYPNCGNVPWHEDHGIFTESVGWGTNDGAGASNFGLPVFNGWPQLNSTTHQQMYWKWLQRSWLGGLRLIIQYAVTNEALCRGSKHLRGTDCGDDMTPIDNQIQAAYDFEAWIDQMYGGPGQGWYRIVTTPDQA